MNHKKQALNKLTEAIRIIDNICSDPIIGTPENFAEKFLSERMKLLHACYTIGVTEEEIEHAIEEGHEQAKGTEKRLTDRFVLTLSDPITAEQQAISILKTYQEARDLVTRVTIKRILFKAANNAKQSRHTYVAALYYQAMDRME